MGVVRLEQLLTGSAASQFYSRWTARRESSRSSLSTPDAGPRRQSLSGPAVQMRRNSCDNRRSRRLSHTALQATSQSTGLGMSSLASSTSSQVPASPDHGADAEVVDEQGSLTGLAVPELTEEPSEWVEVSDSSPCGEDRNAKVRTVAAYEPAPSPLGPLPLHQPPSRPAAPSAHSAYPGASRRSSSRCCLEGGCASRGAAAASWCCPFTGRRLSNGGAPRICSGRRAAGIFPAARDQPWPQQDVHSSALGRLPPQAQEWQNEAVEQRATRLGEQTARVVCAARQGPRQGLCRWQQPPQVQSPHRGAHGNAA